MKHECEVVRDLMLLCADGTASPRSRGTVDEHLQECTACAEVYAEMNREIGAGAEPDCVYGEFGDALRGLRRQRRKRTLLAILAVVVAGVFILLLGARGVVYLRMEKKVQVTAEEVSVTLSRRENGDVIINRLQDVPWVLHNQIIMPDADGRMGLLFYRYWWAERKPEEEWAASYRQDQLEWVEGGGLYYVGRRIAVPSEPEQAKGLSMFYAELGESDRTLIRELRFGDTVIYRHGDSIPLASEGLETYMQFYDKVYGVRGVTRIIVRENSSLQVTPEQELSDAAKLLAPSVPEWQ